MPQALCFLDFFSHLKKRLDAMQLFKFTSLYGTVTSVKHTCAALTTYMRLNHRTKTKPQRLSNQLYTVIVCGHMVTYRLERSHKSPLLFEYSGVAFHVKKWKLRPTIFAGAKEQRMIRARPGQNCKGPTLRYFAPTLADLINC